jgi:hypothetical protein
MHHATQIVCGHRAISISPARRHTLAHQMEGSADAFGVVADYFGKGLFNKVRLVTETPSAFG